MNNKKIIIQKKVSMNQGNQVSLTQEAADCLIGIMQKTGLSAKTAASTIITQAIHNDMIEFIEED